MKTLFIEHPTLGLETFLKTTFHFRDISFAVFSESGLTDSQVSCNYAGCFCRESVRGIFWNGEGSSGTSLGLFMCGKNAFGLPPDLCLHWPCGGERTEGRRTRDTRFRKQHGCSTVGSLPSEVTGGFFRPRKGANGLMVHGPLHGGSGIVANCMELFPDSKIEFGN